MLFSVEQAFVGRDEKRTPLETPAWEGKVGPDQLGPPVRVDQLGSTRTNSD